MDIWLVILDVVVLLSVAMGMGLLFERVGQSAIVAYLLTGFLVGPSVLGLVRTEESIRSLAELGVALLLFTIGLEFSWQRLRSLGAAILVGGALQMILTGLLVFGGAMLAGMATPTAVALAAIIAPSSTACVIRMLTQRAELDSVHGRTSLGVLLFQDAAVIPLMLLVNFLGAEEGQVRSIGTMLQNGLWAALLAIGFFVIVNHVIPRLLDAAVLTRNRELPILFATATCLAASWAAHKLHFSPVLGAFGAGVLLAESRYATWIRADVSVLRTLFVTLFFASVGMLDDLEWIRGHWHWLIMAVPTVLILKGGVIVAAGLILKMPLRYALAAGLCLAQIGEFSFVLAGVAEYGNLISYDIFSLIVGTTVITLILTPYLVGWAARVARWQGKRRAIGEVTGADDGADSKEGARPTDHVVIVGFGPAGRGAWQTLCGEGIPSVIVDMNPRTMEGLDTVGLPMVLGDATQEAVLEKANVSTARAVVITLPDHAAVLQIIAQAKILAPGALILARARYHVRAAEISAAGAVVIDEEQETGNRIGREVLKAFRIAKIKDPQVPAGTATPSP
ncbi:MAG: cation:proton antiporter [Planctomycetota bacterium]|jgi:CPA2 family monovalent cation:H+ antiporter-2